MHQLKVLVFGPDSFISSLNEIKSYLKFNLHTVDNNLNSNFIKSFDILFFHEQIIENKQYKEILNIESVIKILATNSDPKVKNYEGILKLPTSINEINMIVENCSAKKKFNKNSSIKIRNYLLNKNEKKLFKNGNSIILTEKEIQLLELFVNTNKKISKDKILSLVWHYSSNADTHTVETHIYRLRKKVSEKFLDKEFIHNDKEGYYI